MEDIYRVTLDYVRPPSLNRVEAVMLVRGTSERNAKGRAIYEMELFGGVDVKAIECKLEEENDGRE